jgi:hypothetical protein
VRWRGREKERSRNLERGAAEAPVGLLQQKKEIIDTTQFKISGVSRYCAVQEL